MIDRPRLLLATGTLLLAALLHAAGKHGAPTVAAADVPRHLGQEVRVEGLLVHNAPTYQGTTLRVSADGTSVLVSHPLPIDAPLGSWVSATGRVARHEGAWWLHTEEDGVRVTASPEPGRVPWEQLAHAPQAWEGRLIQVAGEVKGELLHGEGAAVALGEGPWPEAGAVVATGTLLHADSCFCYRFHAGSVQVPAWP